MLTARAPAKSS